MPQAFDNSSSQSTEFSLVVGESGQIVALKFERSGKPSTDGGSCSLFLNRIRGVDHVIIQAIADHSEHNPELWDSDNIKRAHITSTSKNSTRCLARFESFLFIKLFHNGVSYPSVKT
jgi:hypothetical protein